MIGRLPATDRVAGAHRDGEPVIAMLVSGGLEHAGGIGRWAGYLQESWLAQGLRPRLVIIDTRGDGHAGAAVLAFAGALVDLVRMRAGGRLDLIHANLSVRGSTFRKMLVGLLARVMGVKLVLHLHGAEYAQFYARLPGLLRRSVRSMFCHAQAIIVLGQAEAAWVGATFGIPPERITILPNGVIRPSLPPTPRAPDAPASIVLLGRIGQRKGVPELLDALASETLRGRPWRATLAGDGEREHYEGVARALGLADRVSFPGWLNQRDSSALMAGSDIVVLPSHAENLPMSVIEALSHGVAVVTTPVGAVPELLVDGETALLVPPGDSPALAQALARLIDDVPLRLRLASAGHALFRERLDIDVLARRLAAVHMEALAKTAT